MLTNILLYILLANNIGLTIFVLKNMIQSSYSYLDCQNLNFFVIGVIIILPCISTSLLSYNLSKKYNSRRYLFLVSAILFISYIAINFKILYILDSNNCRYYIANISFHHWISCIWMISTAILTPIVIAKIASNYII